MINIISSQYSGTQYYYRLNIDHRATQQSSMNRIMHATFKLFKPHLMWILTILCPSIAHAQLDFTPYVTTKAEYNSNVYDLSSRQQAILLTGSSDRSDRLIENIIGFDLGYRFSRQRFHFNAEARRFNYDRFGNLDHNEYLIDGGLDWALTDAIKGTIDFRQERRMASFADRQSTQLSLERDRNINGTADVLVTPEWRIEMAARTHKLDSPLPGFPRFALNENAGSVGVKYLGVDKLATGLTAEYLMGQYTGVPNATRFSQISLLSETDYIVSGLSSLHLNLGYSRRKDQLQGSASSGDFVGSLAYKRVLTGKTTATVELFRQVDSYVAGASSVVDTGARATVIWDMTSKITVNASYVYTNSTFQGQGTIGTLTTGRRDRYQYTILGLDYRILHWLTIRPAAEYEDRHSNVSIASFNAALVSLELRARF